jgi:biopolymer transport protein ExbD
MSFTAETRPRLKPTLPLAPMVDMMFLLVIFFMTASVFRDQELQIDVALPAAAQAQPGSALATRIILTVTADNRLFLGQRELTPPELLATLTELARQFPDEAVVIRGDRASQYGVAVEAMDIARQAGFTNVTLAAVEEE